jgi:hypothetical protein
MPLILKNKSSRLAAQFATVSALRPSSELLDQLQEQLRMERAQHRFNMAEKEKELALALRELAEASLELAHRHRVDARKPLAGGLARKPSFA